MVSHVHVVQDVLEGTVGVYSNLETAYAAADAAKLENERVYDVKSHDVDHSGPEEWIAARDREAAAKSERLRKEKLVDDVELLQRACANVQRLEAFVMPADRDAFDAAWTEYDAKKEDLRLKVREAAKQAGIYNYAAELVVVADKLGYVEPGQAS